ncbi:HIT family protein [Microbacterium sp. NPDC089189]|uniref:HIT family protein n=1 Tax=Microbacterium sp. NPDC089189 TaxID=3154972 RepID=UPI003423022F
MSLSKQDTTCLQCGFGLWIPVDELSSSYMGLYSDARFPGRCIVTLNQHAEHLDELPPDTVSSFMLNVRVASMALRIATGSPRINVAILGNQEGHVHAHLIPRYPESEPRPNKAPWEDTRPRGSMSSADNERYVELIRRALKQVKVSEESRGRKVELRHVSSAEMEPPLLMLSQDAATDLLI